MRTLYISYDGMTDTLGQSQVIPYLAGLSAQGQEIQILSCEKEQAFAKERATIEALLGRHKIGWLPVFYHKRPPVVAKLWDLAVLERAALQLHARWPYQTVHCRSYLAALVGARVKKRLGVRFIFDMRGFWADERLDGGLWSKTSPVHGPIYAYFKHKERRLLDEADAVVCLTRAAVRQLEQWGFHEASRKTTVIPCCADLALFSKASVDEQARARIKTELGLGEAGPVLIYLGSLGTWYGLAEMMELFGAVAKRKPRAAFLFITSEPAERIFAAASQAGVERSRVKVVFARRKDVATYLSLGDAGVFFMKVTRSRAGFSPTKLAEMLAMGLPVILNAGIGDNDEILAGSGAAVPIDELGASGFERAAGELDRLLAVPRDKIRALAETNFALDDGVKRYAALYRSIEQSL